MTLKVIGAGEGRTGTMSIKLALEKLGFGPCHHMSEVIMHPESAALWLDAIDGRPDWDAIYKGYSSAVDAPTCIFWRELAAFYPQAKIILSMRDAESWFESGQATILSPMAHRSFAGTPLEAFFQKIGPRNYGITRPEQMQDKNFMIAYFQRHNAEVQRTIPKDRLLVYDVREGWAPLCRFLGAPIPDAPFPRANTREDMLKMLGARGGKAADMKSVQESLRDKLRPS
jgi:hypothetical protein